MFTKLLKSVAALTLVAGLALTQAGAAQAVSPVNTVPDNPAVAAEMWTTIQPGEYQWYTFKYHAHKSGENDSDGNQMNWAHPVEIRMFSQPNGSATLLLVDGQQARVWQQDGKLEHFGAATEVFVPDYKDKDHDRSAGYASWSSQMTSSGTYYIVIHRDARATGPASYRFTVTGDGVTMQ